jgi:hypothetical protein
MSQSPFRAAAMATALVSEPPRPRVVMRWSLVTPWKPAITAIWPAAKQASRLAGGMSSMRARPWASSVRIGTCQPRNERAFRPMLRRVMASRPAVTCSPDATMASYSSSDSGSPCGRAARAVGPGHQLVGLARHGRDHHRDLLARRHFGRDQARHPADALQVGHRGAAELHHQT